MWWISKCLDVYCIILLRVQIFMNVPQSSIYETGTRPKRTAIPSIAISCLHLRSHQSTCHWGYSYRLDELVSKDLTLYVTFFRLDLDFSPNNNSSYNLLSPQSKAYFKRFTLTNSLTWRELLLVTKSYVWAILGTERWTTCPSPTDSN